MLALIRKEAREVVLGLALLSVLFSCIAIRTGSGLVVLSGQVHLYFVAFFAVLIGATLGFAEFAIEERNTLRYLVHRSTGYRGAFMAKLAVDFAVLALLTIVPLGVHAVWIIWFTDDAEIALWTRYFEVITAAAIGVGAHAIGVFASQLRRPTWLRFTIALAGSTGFLVAAASVTRAPYGAALGPAARYLLWIAAISLPLYAISYRMFVAGNDDDRAFNGKLGVGVHACAFALLAPCAAFIIAAAQSAPVGDLAFERPVILQLKDGSLRLASMIEGQAVEVASHDTKRKVPIYGVRRFIPLFGPINCSWTDVMLSHATAPRTEFEFGAAWNELRQSSRAGKWPTWGDAWFAKRGGRIAVVQHHEGNSTRKLLLLGKGAQGPEFSALAGPIAPLRDHAICIVDPQDRTLWQLDPDAADPKLERIELPNSDEFVRVDLMWMTDMRAGTAISGTSLYDVENCTVVIGAHGTYQWNGDHFVEGARYRHWKLGDDAIPGMNLRVDLTTPDALEPAAVVRDAKTGAVLFEYAYTNDFDLRTAVAYGCSIVRPTVGSVMSFFRDVPANFREIYSLTDPLLTGGRRIWLLALNVALSIALATSAWRRGTLGDPRRIFDTLAILLLGVPAAVVLWLIEPHSRAVRTVVAAPAPREQLLISSV